MNESVATIAVYVALLLIAGLATWAISAMQCDARWSSSGMESRFELISGCMLQRKDGTWIPASAIREVSP